DGEGLGGRCAFFPRAGVAEGDGGFAGFKGVEGGDEGAAGADDPGLHWRGSVLDGAGLFEGGTFDFRDGPGVAGGGVAGEGDGDGGGFAEFEGFAIVGFGDGEGFGGGGGSRG